MNYCKDCKWVEKAEETRFWKCNSPHNLRPPSLVDGKQTPIIYFCENARNVEDWCGKEGKWFEAAW